METSGRIQGGRNYVKKFIKCLKLKLRDCRSGGTHVDKINYNVYIKGRIFEIDYFSAKGSVRNDRRRAAVGYGTEKMSLVPCSCNSGEIINFFAVVGIQFGNKREVILRDEFG